MTITDRTVLLLARYLSTVRLSTATACWFGCLEVFTGPRAAIASGWRQLAPCDRPRGRGADRDVDACGRHGIYL